MRLKHCIVWLAAVILTAVAGCSRPDRRMQNIAASGGPPATGDWIVDRNPGQSERHRCSHGRNPGDTILSLLGTSLERRFAAVTCEVR